MIVHLRGELIEKSPVSAVIEAGGVGYELFIPVSTYEKLPRAGETVKLLVSHIVRDDGETLFGFATPDEREMFTLLFSVSGVGPKTAIQILSAASLNELASSIAGGDVKRVSSIKGVGKKTAGKICVELKDKVNKFVFASIQGSSGVSSMALDSVMALRALGFSEEASSKMVTEVFSSHPEADTVEKVVKLALASR
jgi:Holliday junction DNA helicase RuvA